VYGRVGEIVGVEFPGNVNVAVGIESASELIV
jgi:hypothetical protein